MIAEIPPPVMRKSRSSFREGEKPMQLEGITLANPGKSELGEATKATYNHPAFTIVLFYDEAGKDWKEVLASVYSSVDRPEDHEAALVYLASQRYDEIGSEE